VYKRDELDELVKVVLLFRNFLGLLNTMVCIEQL
jgi:hypothetical protein